ncbi:MAG: HAMP domain-containing sensor histidine kinase [Gammaproteobacteria bacterium]|nr:HAMP domain-containing sensor histidine kinase [Gammaproteobacteria bacterium]
MDFPEINIDVSQVLATSTHDIKHSLGILLNQITSLSNNNQEINPDTQSQLKHLEYEIKRIDNNVVKSLTLYKLNQKQYLLDIQQHSVRDCFEELAAEYQQLMQSKNITIEIQCDDDLLWYFDRNLIMGSLSTLLNNAYRYSKDKIVLHAERDTSTLSLYIKDNGSGYPTEILVNPNKPTQKESGFSSHNTGLGIYFTTKIAKLHRLNDRQGHISISNQGIDNGGQFGIHLP